MSGEQGHVGTANPKSEVRKSGRSLFLVAARLQNGNRPGLFSGLFSDTAGSFDGMNRIDGIVRRNIGDTFGVRQALAAFTCREATLLPPARTHPYQRLQHVLADAPPWRGAGSGRYCLTVWLSHPLLSASYWRISLFFLFFIPPQSAPVKKNRMVSPDLLEKVETGNRR